MFDFSILITVIIAILIFYFTLFINLNKEIGDLTSTSNNPTENYLKINNRIRKLRFLNIITLLLIIIVILLFALPNILTLIDLSNFEPISFSDIGNFLLKLFPFKKGFFSNKNFKFSYITEIALSFITVTIILSILYEFFYNKVLNVISLIILTFSFIWINNFVSLFLTHCIIHCFPFLSLIFNLLIYALILFVILIFLSAIDDRSIESIYSKLSTKKESP